MGGRFYRFPFIAPLQYWPWLWYEDTAKALSIAQESGNAAKANFAAQFQGQRAEMFRCTLPQGAHRYLLDRLANRLTKIASEARKLEPG